MKPSAKLLLRLLAALTLPAVGAFADPDNSNIDMPGFLQVAHEAAEQRLTHRVSEDEFIRLSQEPGTMVLDTRSRAKYDLLHVSGAINLSFPDIDIESLQKTLPDKTARVLIYCNNNFAGNQAAFASKAPSASLNLSTYVALYNYGYRNVYELAPHVDVHKTKLNLVGSAPVSDARPAMQWLKAHRLSEEAFVQMSQEPETVILDTSDSETYRLVHVAGARHLTWQELEDAEAVAKVLPDKEARVLIYENNNYRTVRRRFEINQRMAVAESFDDREWSGENIAVYQALSRLGYQHVYELAPYVRIDRSELPLVAHMVSIDLDTPVALSLHDTSVTPVSR